MWKHRRISAFASAILLSVVVLLAPIGARAEEPAPRKTTGYPAVDMPPTPEKPAMTPDEQLKLKNELTTARDCQAPMGKATVGVGSGKPVKP